MHGSLTSDLFWRASAVMAAVDAVLLLLAARISTSLFEKLKWHLAGAAGALYALLWGVFASVAFWDDVYGLLFPAWARWLLPPFYGLLFAAIALGFWAICWRAPRWPAVWFVVLGGLVSLVGHGIGMSRGLMRVPMLASVDPVAALVFGVFEFMAYFSVVTGASVLLYHFSVGVHRQRGRP